MMKAAFAAWLMLLPVLALALEKPDETPGKEGEWGLRPGDGEVVERDPPPFVWRPQEEATGYLIQVAADGDFAKVLYERDDLELNCVCPHVTLGAGDFHWRFAYRQGDEVSPWSSGRRFTVSEEAVEFPRPTDEDLLGRIPEHPRLFFRPEDLARMRELAQGDLKSHYDALVKQCEGIIAEPPDITEPPKYPEGMERISPEWMDMWWGNRRRCSAVTNSAATLAFTYLLSGEERYAAEAQRLLMAGCSWDPKGSTGFRYNDEAGMPFMYFVSRAYTWLGEYLPEEDRAKVREVMSVRGAETYNLLRPRHTWRPYSSHSNRSWHFLGEMGIAFYGELPEAADWVTFAADVSFCVYPVWSDSDGGWHEGSAYWSSYLSRQTWWLDVQKAAFGIDGYERPFFGRAGDFALYNMPPGVEDGGFGDLCSGQRASSVARLMAIFARKAGNPYWQWYADESGGEQSESGYIGFLRALTDPPQGQPPVGLPSSKHFRGTGYAALHTDLVERDRDVQLLFKSSPFGTYSHGYESQNAFLLAAYGKPLLIRTGRRDGYGSAHHKNWQWQTRSVNSILVNGEGQRSHSFADGGTITDFFTSEHFDYVAGDATDAYQGKLTKSIRRILFCKPEGIVVIHDELAAPEPATFQWLLHAPNEFELGDGQVRTVNGDSAVQVTWLTPEGLDISQTNEFDPPPRRINLVQWHLTAETPEKQSERHFVTVLQPYRTPDGPPATPTAEAVDGGCLVRAGTGDERLEVLVRFGDEPVEWGEVTADARVTVWRMRGDEVVAHARVGE